MSQGLKPHRHEYFLYDTKSHYNHKKGIMVRNVTYMCMICGRLTHERYEDYVPPPNEKKPKALMRYRSRHRGSQ